MNDVRVRIAPSPTGFPHIGTIFQALFNYAFARHNKGKFIVRIEDTDRTRYIEGAEEAIFGVLKWFGLTPDESPIHGGNYGPYRQSDKQKEGIYKKYAEQLIPNNAYYCFCTPHELDTMRKKQQQQGKPPMYDGRCKKINPSEAKMRAIKEPYVIRMKITSPPVINIHDDIRGNIEFKKDLIDDQVILKSDGFPTYHLAVVIDDHDMKISHIIRGEEWLSSTPKHVLLYQYFGWTVPSFLHTPLLRNPDGSKLSKRHNHSAVNWYKEQGFLPEAILNYLANLVYNHPKGEIFSLEEFVDSFDNREKIHSVGARFDLKKLEWMNGEYIRKTQKSKLKSQILTFYNHQLPENLVEKTIPLIQERIKKLSDYFPLCEFFFKKPDKYEIDLSGKEKIFQRVYERLEKIKEWKGEVIGIELQQIAIELDIKNSDFFMLIRVAITGKKISPPLNESMEILGQKEVLNRVIHILNMSS